ncbi:hypothetical protein MHYP_G00119270 [Metynnis hypsauchen]
MIKQFNRGAEKTLKRAGQGGLQEQRWDPLQCSMIYCILKRAKSCGSRRMKSEDLRAENEKEKKKEGRALERRALDTKEKPGLSHERQTT